MVETNFFLYILLKFIVYSIWLYIGFRFFKAPDNWDVLNASSLGFVRMCMGVPIGIISIILVAYISSTFLPNYGLWTFYIIWIPARYFIWLITTKMIHKTEPSHNQRWWISGGVILSCLMDIPLFKYIVPLMKGF